MNNAELITALRVEPFEVGSFGLARIINQAADALEAAEKRIAELNTKCADLQSQINSMGSEIEELLPKEG